MRLFMLRLMQGRAVAAAALVGVGVSLPAASDAAPDEAAEQPIFRFGCIADIQYCDIDDASNFAGTEVRMYRGTLKQTRAAVEHWNSLSSPEVSFVLQLGDLIDGQNAGGYGAGLTFAEPQSGIALSRVARELARCVAPIYHAIGNHELYNFDWSGIRARLQGRPVASQRSDWQVTADTASTPTQPPVGGESATSSSQPAAPVEPFAIRPAGGGWTFLMLNCYAVSVEQDKSLPGYKAAMELIRVHNPKCHAALTEGKTNVNFFAGVEDESNLRYVPFNGGLGAGQRAWLATELRSAVQRGDRIVLLSHVPIYPPAASPRTVVYDADDVLELVRTEGAGHVVAVLAGHMHRGGYARDDAGVHHLTWPSPLNYADCYGHVDVFSDRLEVKMAGSEAAKRMGAPAMLEVPPLPPSPPTLLKCVLESIP